MAQPRDLHRTDAIGAPNARPSGQPDARQPWPWTIRRPCGSGPDWDLPSGRAPRPISCWNGDASTARPDLDHGVDPAATGSPDAQNRPATCPTATAGRERSPAFFRKSPSPTPPQYFRNFSQDRWTFSPISPDRSLRLACSHGKRATAQPNNSGRQDMTSSSRTQFPHQAHHRHRGPPGPRDHRHRCHAEAGKRLVVPTTAIAAGLALASSCRPSSCAPPPTYYAPPQTYYAPPQTYYAPSAAYYAPQSRAWIPAHWQNGYWVPGHWS